jgi:hypothetical protein
VVLLDIYKLEEEPLMMIKLKAISGSSPIFALSNYTTFSKTQTGATVPFNEHANLNGSEARV